MSRSIILALTLGLAGCGGSGTTPTDAAGDTSTDAAVPDAPAADAPGTDGSRCTTDADGDGHRAISCGGDDCDDADPHAYPTNIEVCDAAGHDEDCDPATLGPDADADGFAATNCCDAQPTGVPLCGTDCDDTRATVSPSAIEACNAVDDNCNGMIDEGVTMMVCFDDSDGDTYAAAGAVSRMACACSSTQTTRAPIGTDLDCNDSNAGVHPGVAEICDALDNDCNGHVDDGVGTAYYADCDGDGYAPTGAMAVVSCSVPAPPSSCTGTSSGWAAILGDCNDLTGAAHPGATELCDGIDNDCDGVIDPGCGCTNGTTQPCGQPDGAGGFLMRGICVVGTQTCGGGTWGACIGATLARSETCNGVDDDCNGVTDDGVGTTYFADCDGDGFGRDSVTMRACAVPVSAAPICGGVATARWATTGGDCNDTQSAAHPGGLEICDGLDNDCNATTDDPSPTNLWCNGAGGGLPHATAVCASGSCVVGSCAAGYADCSAAPGCETTPATDLANCGFCGHACRHPSCSAGVCQQDYVAVVTGSTSACARKGSGELDCWGNNDRAQLGLGTTGGAHTTPAAVPGMTDIIDMAFGANTDASFGSGAWTCAVHATGSLSCWGHVTYSTVMTSPSTVTAIGPVSHVRLQPNTFDNSYACGGTSLSRFYYNDSTTSWVVAGEFAPGASCTSIGQWGTYNSAAVLGADGSLYTDGARYAGVREVAGGYYIAVSGDVYSYDDGFSSSVGLPFHDAVHLGYSGGLGIRAGGTLFVSYSGAAVQPTIIDAVNVSGSESFGCALRRTGELVCWGGNAFGQLGNGTTTDSAVPVTVTGS